MMTARWNTIISLAFGVLAAILFIAVLTGLNVPFAGGGMTSFIALAVIGVAACVASNSHSATMFGWTSSTYWTNPMSIIGMVLGAIALLLIVLTVIGINIPFVTGYTTAFTILGVIVFLKVGLKILQNAMLK